MKVLKVSDLSEVPEGYTGIVDRKFSITSANVDRFYYKDGKWHREDGPARVYNVEGEIDEQQHDFHLEGETYNTEKAYYQKLYSMYRDSDPEKARLAMAKLLAKDE